jgi:hypothetical protein
MAFKAPLPKPRELSEIRPFGKGIFGPGASASPRELDDPASGSLGASRRLSSLESDTNESGSGLGV